MATPEDQPVWNLYRFDEPQRVQATPLNDEVVYFDCCMCGEEDAILVGYMATRQDASLKDMAYRYFDDERYRRPAFFCQKCWDTLLTDNPL
ncbi:MAG: hypothetical protein ACYC3X_29385 [Pirellulaceae bacterium]